MKLFKRNSTKWSALIVESAILLTLVGSLASCAGSRETSAKAGSASQVTFATPSEASQALQTAARAKDETGLTGILGANSKAILSSGDPEEDKALMDSFVSKYDQMNRWVTMTDKSKFLYVGADNYAFPIPLVQASSSKWYFDTKAGEDEVLTRRIGRNELLAIDACNAIANAEEIFFQRSTHQYTTDIISTAGKQDGLYWEVAGDQESSPLGNVSEFAKVVASPTTGQPQVFDGYIFRILTAQGDQATGGAKSYIVNGELKAGFAVIASPVKYQDSGIMTFILSREGFVYEKDLGPQTADLAAAIKDYNPTSDWNPAE